MNVTNVIRLYLRIYQNNYLHLNRVKLNKNSQDWHYTGCGQFYLEHPLLESHDMRDRLILPFIRQLHFEDDEQEEAFWGVFSALNCMFYIVGGMSDGQNTTMDNRARLFVALAKNNTHYDDNFRSMLIKKLLYNCFIDITTVWQLRMENKILYFEVDSHYKIPLKEFIQNWQVLDTLTEQEEISFKVLQDYFLSLVDFLENGLVDNYFNTYQLPTHISPTGRRIKIAKKGLIDIYPYSIKNL